MLSLPQADMRQVVWNSSVYEPSDDSYALVDAVLKWLQGRYLQGSGPQALQVPTQQDGNQQELLPQLLQDSSTKGMPQTAAKPATLQEPSALPCTCLEVGCGSGYIICSVALALQQLHQRLQGSKHLTAASTLCYCAATDISADALTATAATLAAHQVHGVELLQTDLVAGLLPRLAGTVDLLLFNPPYVPTPDEELNWDGIARAWAGGYMGRRVTDRLLSQLPALLSDQGHAFIVTVLENNPQEILQVLAAAGLQGNVALTRAADEESLQILHIWRG